MQKGNWYWKVERTLLTKAEEETNPSFGKEPLHRPLNDFINFGFINLDKTSGPSSHEVTAWAKRIIGVKRAGHGGTLEV